MKHLKRLNSKEKRNVLEKLREQFGFKEELEGLLFKSNKDKYYLVSERFAELNVEGLRIDSLGLYVFKQHGPLLRPSFEGSQLIGPASSKNVLTISKSQLLRWVKGEDLELSVDGDGFFIVRHGSDYFGCGKPVRGVFKNYLSKSRRLKTDAIPF